MFKHKRRAPMGLPRPHEGASSSPDDATGLAPEAAPPAVLVALLYPVGGAEAVPETAAGEYVAVCDAGRAIVTACDVPPPWRLSQKGYSGYAAYLEDPATGDRMRLDMVCVAEAYWVAMRRVGPGLRHLRFAWVAPVGDGVSGTPILSAQPLPEWGGQLLTEM